MSEENKVIDEVNTSGVVEQPVDAEEIPPVKTEAIPPVNTEPTHPVQPPVEPAQKLEDYYKETAEDRVAEEEYEQAVKDPQNRKEKIDQIKSIFPFKVIGVNISFWTGSSRDITLWQMAIRDTTC